MIAERFEGKKTAKIVNMCIPSFDDKIGTKYEGVDTGGRKKEKSIILDSFIMGEDETEMSHDGNEGKNSDLGKYYNKNESGNEIGNENQNQNAYENNHHDKNEKNNINENKNENKNENEKVQNSFQLYVDDGEERTILNSSINKDTVSTNYARTYTSAIQDNYKYWHSCGESDVSGKVFFVDPVPPENAVSRNSKTAAASSYKDNISNGNSNKNSNNNSNDNKNGNNKSNFNDDNSNNSSSSSSNNNNNNKNNKNNNNDNSNNNNNKDNNISHANTSDEMPIQIDIFFDDNIERDRAHIVDVRSVRTFKPLAYSETINVFITKVEPYYAITNENYFIELLHEIISKQMVARNVPR